MTWRGTRSKKAIARRQAIASAFIDREMAETICRTPFDRTVEFYVGNTNRTIREETTIEAGDVTKDSRGRGCLQEIQPVRR